MAEQSKFARFSISPTGEKPEVSEQERLLKLYWNRAELKKEYAELRNERYKLLEKIKHARSETLKAQEELRSLESLLTDPEAAQHALVFFQLKQLWRRANAQLRVFSAELKKQQEEKEQKAHVARYDLDRQRRLEELNKRIKAMKSDCEELNVVVTRLDAKLEQRQGIWNFAKRRRLHEKADKYRFQLKALNDQVEELFNRRIKLESDTFPEHTGLSLEGRRLINLAVIALAQEMLLYFRENSLAELARMTNVKNVREVQYGTRRECENLTAVVRKSLTEMKPVKTLVKEMKLRTDYLRSQVQYAKPEDAIPAPSSVPIIPVEFKEDKTPAGNPVGVNVLSEDYWEIGSVLL